MKDTAIAILGFADELARFCLPATIWDLEADRAFARSRRKAAMRHLLGAFRRRERGLRNAEGGSETQFELGIDQVAGLSGMRGLPSLPRQLRARWKLEYARLDTDAAADAPFELSLENGGWHLGGGIKELMRLELLRAKGRKLIAAKSAGAARDLAQGNFEREMEHSHCQDCPDLAAS
jgi:hypothetical protein